MANGALQSGSAGASGGEPAMGIPYGDPGPGRRGCSFVSIEVTTWLRPVTGREVGAHAAVGTVSRGPSYASSRSALTITSSVLPSCATTAGPMPQLPVV